jgi:quaternary ammonium compound-resistance protein SugE
MQWVWGGQRALTCALNETIIHAMQHGAGTTRSPSFFRGRPRMSGAFIMAWVILFIAGLFEVAWAIGLKYTDGFSKLWPSVGTAAAMLISVVLLGLAMRTLPVGTAYAVWTGIGAVGTVILGIVLFGDPANAARLACVALIVAGILGLKLTSA